MVCVEALKSGRMEHLITPKEFMDYERNNSRAFWDEWIDAISPCFERYQIYSSDFLSREAFPTYRLDETGNQLTLVYQDKNATPITFSDLSVRESLFTPLLREGYISTNETILAYHCTNCLVWVIKDGTHRLINWAVKKENRLITVYQVSSRDWSRAQVDMPNYCKCMKNQP